MARIKKANFPEITTLETFDWACAAALYKLTPDVRGGDVIIRLSYHLIDN